MSVNCPKCGHDSQTALPSSAWQPLLDQLAYTNPETLESGLHHGETVLVCCRANVGGLVGTDQRVLVIKKGQVHEYSYTDIEDVAIQKVGWFLDAVCQLVTKQTPFQPMKSKAADASLNALSLLRGYLPVFESAKVRLLEIRDQRRCRSCGTFVPITAADWGDTQPPKLIEPIPNSGACVLATNLLPGERIICQAHGARYYKTMIVTNQRVMIVLGRGQKHFHAFPLTQLEGADVDTDGLRLRVKGRAFVKLQGMALVTADSAIPANEGDADKLRTLADSIDELVRQGAS
jgi:Bacterial PH domain